MPRADGKCRGRRIGMRTISIYAMQSQICATHSTALRGSARRLGVPVAAALGLVACGPAFADEAALLLKVRDHRFYPPELQVAAGVRQQRIIENRDASAEEFDRQSRHREKILAPRSRTNRTSVRCRRDATSPSVNSIRPPPWVPSSTSKLPRARNRPLPRAVKRTRR
ncbi:exported hypothetical protein [Burkholderiales bacterium]|nr:exported hypothetical protein [Burkholderiales bacterium]